MATNSRAARRPASKKALKFRNEPVEGCKNPSKTRTNLSKTVNKKLKMLFECTGDCGFFILLPGSHNAEAHMCTVGFVNTHTKSMLEALMKTLNRNDVRRRLQPLIDGLPVASDQGGAKSAGCEDADDTEEDEGSSREGSEVEGEEDSVQEDGDAETEEPATDTAAAPGEPTAAADLTGAVAARTAAAAAVAEAAGVPAAAAASGGSSGTSAVEDEDAALHAALLGLRSSLISEQGDGSGGTLQQSLSGAKRQHSNLPDIHDEGSDDDGSEEYVFEDCDDDGNQAHRTLGASKRRCLVTTEELQEEIQQALHGAIADGTWREASVRSIRVAVAAKTGWPLGEAKVKKIFKQQADTIWQRLEKSGAIPDQRQQHEKQQEQEQPEQLVADLLQVDGTGQHSAKPAQDVSGHRRPRRAAAGAHRTMLAELSNNIELEEVSHGSQQRIRGSQQRAASLQPPVAESDMNAVQKALWTCRAGDICKVLKLQISFDDLNAAEQNIKFAEEMISRRFWTAQAVQQAVKGLRVTLSGAKVARSLHRDSVR